MELSNEIKTQISNEVEAKVEQLEKWRKEAKELLNPILDWGQKELPIGTNIPKETLRRAKEYESLVDILDEARLQIEYLQKKFGETGSGNNILARIETALTPKTGSDE